MILRFVGGPEHGHEMDYPFKPDPEAQWWGGRGERMAPYRWHGEVDERGRYLLRQDGNRAWNAVKRRVRRWVS